MIVNELIKCADFPCTDTDKNAYIVPDRDIDAEKVKIVMITEAPPNDKSDYFYAEGNPFYLQTTVQAFKDAGANVNSLQDILDTGAYITTAVKCGKTQYAISNDTMKNCSELLEKEISLFPKVKEYVIEASRESVSQEKLPFISGRRRRVMVRLPYESSPVIDNTAEGYTDSSGTQLRITLDFSGTVIVPGYTDACTVVNQDRGISHHASSLGVLNQETTRNIITAAKKL